VLEHEVPGVRIDRVSGRSINMRRPLAIERLVPLLTGASFLTFRRRAKYLLFDFDRPGSLLVHLGMSGRVQLADETAPRADHTHMTLELSDGRQLRFVDPRRFGLIDWLAPGSEDGDASLARLGIEPLDPDMLLSLPPLLHARRSPLKSLLLDQRLVAGIGNIYAAEALWRAGIHPRRAGNRTSLARLGRLARSAQEVLVEAVERGGTTLRDFTKPDGEMGFFAQQLAVYGRQGEECGRCGSAIRSEVIGGRTTAWCPRCQR
jgi:formamidopyrimidine-DNA glycosylase